MKKIDFGLVVLIIILLALALVSYKLYKTVQSDDSKAGDALLEKAPAQNKGAGNGLIQIKRRAKIEDAKPEALKTVATEIEAGITYAAIIVDDLGENRKYANELLSLGIDLTFSILPYETNSIEIANTIREKGFESMLHLPMEPKDSANHDPGKGVLLTDMSDEEIRARSAELLDRIPGISGANNHMGSKFSSDCDKVSIVMSVVKEKGLYFLDSMTSSDSCIAKTASSYGIPTASRHVFLDNDKEAEKILAQIDTVIRISKKYGYAIAICHPYPETIEALRKSRDRFDENGISIMRLSKVIELRTRILAEKNDKVLSSQSVTR